MNDTHLPDDLSQWPSDPHALLGVERNVDRRELRRAYTRLIRAFKPEHFPEQFRRIREAYESLDSYLQYREHYNLDGAAAPQESGQDYHSSLNKEDTAGSDAAQAARAELEKPAEAADDPAAAAWRLAKQGNPAEAYAKLKALGQQAANDSALYARLYWLLVLEPKLDPDRDRREWLIDGLRATSFDGRLMELYNRELQGDPEEALRPRCHGLLHGQYQLFPWARFVACRWEYVGLLERWDIITKELQEFRQNVIQANRTLWARMLLTAIEQFLWQDDPQAHDLLVQTYRQELDEYSEEHTELSGDLDRCEYLMELTAGRRRLRAGALLAPDVVDGLRKVLRRAWVLPFNAIKPELLLLLRPFVENPRKGLGDMDRVCNVGVVLLQQLNALVDALYQQRHDFTADPAAESLAADTEAFFRAHDWSVYDTIRPLVLMHCIVNRITIHQFSAALEKASLPFANQGFSQQLFRDLPLRCLTTACLAFWQ
jgi:hypothetical protein